MSTTGGRMEWKKEPCQCGKRVWRDEKGRKEEEGKMTEKMRLYIILTGESSIRRKGL
jgi:hypothetical protein